MKECPMCGSREIRTTVRSPDLQPHYLCETCRAIWTKVDPSAPWPADSSAFLAQNARLIALLGVELTAARAQAAAANRRATDARDEVSRCGEVVTTLTNLVDDLERWGLVLADRARPADAPPVEGGAL